MEESTARRNQNPHIGRSYLLHYQVTLILGASIIITLGLALSPGKLYRLKASDVINLANHTHHLNTLNSLSHKQSTNQETRLNNTQPLTNELNLRGGISDGIILTQNVFTNFSNITIKNFNLYGLQKDLPDSFLDHKRPITACPSNLQWQYLSDQFFSAIRKSFKILIDNLKSVIMSLTSFSAFTGIETPYDQLSPSNLSKPENLQSRVSLFLYLSDLSCSLTFAPQNLSIIIMKDRDPSTSGTFTNQLPSKQFYSVSVDDASDFLKSNIIPLFFYNSKLTLSEFISTPYFALMDTISSGEIQRLFLQLESYCLFEKHDSKHPDLKFINFEQLSNYLNIQDLQPMPHSLILSTLSKINLHFPSNDLISPCSPLNLIIQKCLKGFKGIAFYFILLVGWLHSLFSHLPLTLIHLPRLFTHMIICLYRMIILYMGGNYLSTYFFAYFDFSDHIILALMCLLIFSIEFCALIISHPKNSFLAYCIHTYYYLLTIFVYYSIFITSFFFHSNLEIITGLILGIIALFGFFWFLTEVIKFPSLSRIGILRTW